MQVTHCLCFALPCALLFAQATLADNAETANKSNNPLNMAPGEAVPEPQVEGLAQFTLSTGLSLTFGK
jgi:hypothetical protein